MSPENGRGSLEPVDFEATELTLGLPGIPSDGGQRSGTKRGFLETVDLKITTKRAGEYQNNDISSIMTISLPPKARVVGWPPVRKTRILTRKYVKVAVDGAAYLRKVDLETYHCYEQLFGALMNMFPGLTIRKVMDVEKSGVNEFVPTYQDKDGDWMLVRDVPWTMFVESCKRLRLMKSADALGLVPRTFPSLVST